MPTSPDPSFEALLQHLRDTRGFEFGAYKRSTLMRRVLKRMSTVGMGSFEDYIDYLEVHQEEFRELFNTILINVTGFLRDLAAWEYLADEVLPQVVAKEAPIRIWSAGCATGEEAYTIAILLAEELGAESFRERVKIY